MRQTSGHMAVSTQGLESWFLCCYSVESQTDFPHGDSVKARHEGEVKTQAPMGASSLVSTASLVLSVFIFSCERKTFHSFAVCPLQTENTWTLKSVNHFLL